MTRRDPWSSDLEQVFHPADATRPYEVCGTDCADCWRLVCLGQERESKDRGRVF